MSKKTDDELKQAVGLVSKYVCSENSYIGDVLEHLAGSAKECWCCSMVRGILIGGIVVGAAWIITALL